VASPDIWASARKTAVGMCVLAAQERQDDMKDLLRMYLHEQAFNGVSQQVAMMQLVNAMLSVSLHVAARQGDATETFAELAETMAVL
jgi:hypothetical protein